MTQFISDEEWLLAIVRDAEQKLAALEDTQEPDDDPAEIERVRGYLTRARIRLEAWYAKVDKAERQLQEWKDGERQQNTHELDE